MRAKGITTAVWAAVACLCGWALGAVYGYHPAQAAQMSAAKEAAPAPGATSGSLQVSIQPAKSSFAGGEKMTFRTQLRNAGDADLILNLGFMLANGKKQYPTAVTLVITDSAGKKRKLQLKGPAGIAGRVDDLLVPLPVGAAYVLETRLSDYCCLETMEFRIEPASGQYTIAAAYKGEGPKYVNSDTEGVRLISVLTGEVTSDTSAFSVAAK